MLSTVSNLLQVPTPGLSSSPGKSVTPSPKADETQSAESLSGDVARIGRLAGLAAGGGFAAYKLGDKASNHIKEVADAIKTGSGLQPAMPGIKNLMGVGVKGAGLSAMVAAGVSAVTNGIEVVQGKQSGQTAVQNVITDSMSGAIGGFGAVTAAGAGSLLLKSMGMAGLPLTIGTVAMGAAASVGMGTLVKKFQDNAAAEMAKSAA